MLGSASPQTVVGLAARHGDSTVPADLGRLQEFFRFRDFAHFIEVYKSVAALVRDAEDICLLVHGLARELAGQRVRYAEVMVCPYLHEWLGLPGEELLAGLVEGRRAAARDHGVAVNWIFDTPGEGGVAAGQWTIDLIRRTEPDGLVGFSLAGLEAGVDRRDYADIFAPARALGLHSTPHAGESVGPGQVWAALRDLRADRVGHATSCTRDVRLMEYLGEHRIPIEVCPTSNVRTRVVPEMSAHPVVAMLAAGLTVTVNTDDPPMFGADLNGEYLCVAELARLDWRGVAELAANAVRASFLEPAGKAALLAAISAALQGAEAGSGPEIGPPDETGPSNRLGA